MPGDVFVIPPMIAHAYVDTDKLEVYHILFKKSFIEQNKFEAKNVKGFLQLIEIEPFLRENVSKSFFLHLNPAQLISLKKELEFIDDGGIFSWEECSLMKYHTIWKTLYWFSKILDEQLHSKKEMSKKRYEIVIMELLEYIHLNYGKKITIETLCEKVYMSRSTFLRAFNEMCGISPIEYLNNYRCKKAEELLAGGGYSKTTVAYDCGFYDLSHMERMLKKYGFK